MSNPDEEIKEEIVVDNTKSEYQPVTGGKRKSKRRVNPALGKWVAFVKRVQKEEKLSYKDAMMRAKARKDKGEKWMGGGEPIDIEEEDIVMEGDMGMEDDMEGGRRRRKHRRRTQKRRGSKKRRRTRRR
jgi:hypothetical protein